MGTDIEEHTSWVCLRQYQPYTNTSLGMGPEVIPGIDSLYTSTNTRFRTALYQAKIILEPNSSIRLV
jgi:hypothetical protein